IARSIVEHAERPAICAKGETLTYGELGARVAGIRLRLQQIGLERSPRIGVVTGDDVSTYAAIVALMLNGTGYVPLNRKSPLARNLDIVRDAELSAIVAARPDELTAAAGLPL